VARSSASTAAFCRPYSQLGATGASAGICGRVPSNTLSDEANTTAMPCAISRSISTVVCVTLM
jgi:hypothetical protein